MGLEKPKDRLFGDLEEADSTAAAGAPAGGGKKKKKKGGVKSTAADAPAEPVSLKQQGEADLKQQLETAVNQEMGEGVLDPEVQAGRRVLDPMTRMPYYLPNDDQVRLSLCFPEADELLKGSGTRLLWSSSTTGEEVRDLLLGAAAGGNATMKQAALANFDYMGYDAALLLTGLKMNAQYRKAPPLEVDALVDARNLYLIAMSSLTCPFRQLMKEAELSVGGVVNDFPGITQLGGKLAEADVAACWLLLKAAVATWEDKLVFDQLQRQRLEQEDPPNGGKIKKQDALVATTAKNCAMWQEMSGVFGAAPGVAPKLLPELRFLDGALPLPSDTDVRFYAVKDFCAEKSVASGVGVPETELKERLRRLSVLVAKLPPANYGAVAGKVAAVARSLEAGAGVSEVSFYEQARAKGLCDFETYEMPLNDLSALREWEKEASAGKRSDKDEKGKARKNPLVKPTRPTGLDWYDSEMREEELPEFQRTGLASNVDDPESWDETKEINKLEAAAGAAASGDGAFALPSKQWGELLAGRDGTDEDQAAWEAALVEDEALLAALLTETYKPGVGDEDWATGGEVLSAFDVELSPEALGLSEKDFAAEMKAAQAEIEEMLKGGN